jgi:dienelactone hydrolase
MLNNKKIQDQNQSIIGLYGQWAAGLNETGLPFYSFRRKEWTDLYAWQQAAKKRVFERMVVPETGSNIEMTVIHQYVYDGLHIEELSWQLPYGRPTLGILLKPSNQKGRLPAIIAFHDHSADKYFGTAKITRIEEARHLLIEMHQQEYYDNLAWANEVAKRGYVVFVSDCFSFGSRRVMLKDVPDHLRQGLNEPTFENNYDIQAYNKWASGHEHIMAKSLFSAGTTWPGVFFSEDLKALDLLCSRQDVDVTRIGCGGLSGGGLRSIFLSGLDERIKCAVCVGFMTTWRDLVINKSFTHTWMAYVPLLPNDLDLPEVMALRVPLPTFILNNEQDNLFTLSEMKVADNILQEVFEKAGASDHYKCAFYPGSHKFDKCMQSEAFDWFDRWLK